MAQPYLPVLPLIAKYPFVSLTAPFLQYEYGNIDSIFSSEKELDVEAKKLGKEIVGAVIDGMRVEVRYPQASFMCTSCDEKCFECEAILAKNFYLCSACGKCFESCVHEVSEEIYRNWRMLARRNAVAYISSRVIVSQLEPWVRRKYAVREADRYSELIREEEEGVIKLISADLGVRANFGRSVRVHVTSYLRCAARIKSDNWRLVNRKLEKGWIELDRDDFLRLLKEKLREKLEEPLEYDALKECASELSARAAMQKREVKDLGEVDVSCFPPCMKKILSDLQHGVNVPHTARFAITSFLLNIGLNTNEIITLFSSAPDFDEEKTRYQVEHIAGAKGTEYSCPACDTMRTYHNCYAECRVSHPISYYEICKRRKEEKSKGERSKNEGRRGKSEGERGRDKANPGDS